MRQTLHRLALAALLGLAPSTTHVAAPPQPDQPILSFLSEVIAWYRQQVAVAQLATEPADVVFASAAGQQAREVLQLVFPFARADAALQPGQAAPSPATGTTQSLDVQSLIRTTSDAASAVERAQARVDALQRRLRAASGRQRSLLQQALAEAQGELQLAQIGSPRGSRCSRRRWSRSESRPS